MGSDRPAEPPEHSARRNDPGPVDDAQTPLTLDVLADLHAGALDQGAAAVLWQRAHHDPQARETLSTLDRVRADLASWIDSPAPEVPAAVVDRIVAALRAAAATPTLPADTRTAISPAGSTLNLVTGPTDGNHRQRPPAKRRWIAYSTAGIAAAAACAALAVLLVANTGRHPSGTTEAQTGPSLSQVTASRSVLSPAPPATATGGAEGIAPDFPVSGNDITALVGRTPEFGALDDAQRRASCLAGLGLAPSTPVLGAQTLDIDGPAVLMVLPAERPGELLAVAVRPGCDRADPQRVAQTRVGAAPGR